MGGFAVGEINAMARRRRGAMEGFGGASPAPVIPAKARFCQNQDLRD